MLRLEDSPEVETHGRQIADKIRNGQHLALPCDATTDSLVAATIRALGDAPVVVARVPRSLDQVARTVLELAQKVAPEARAEVDAALRLPTGGKNALGLLSKALTGVKVVVERADLLSGVSSQHHEVFDAVRETRRELSSWVLQRADLLTTSIDIAGEITAKYVTPWTEVTERSLFTPSVSRSGTAARAASMSGSRSRTLWSHSVSRSGTAAWSASTSGSRSGARPRYTPRSGWAEPPVRLTNGEPRDSKTPWRPGVALHAYELSLQLEALGVDGGAAPFAPSEEVLRGRVRSALPEGVAYLLDALAVHERPMALQTFYELPGFTTAAFERGASLALWRVRDGAVVAGAGWSSWCVQNLWPIEITAVRRVLADTFARIVHPEDPSSYRAGVEVLEAARHLTALGDIDRALRYSRYGSEMLVGYARELSALERYSDAAAIYGRLLNEGTLPKPLRGYVRHYYHFNRSHAHPELEPVTETARGYDEAIKDWPENAIFWSRAVRAWCLAGDRTRAMEQLESARRQVPDHADKGTRLIARTARRLAELGLHLDAVEVLGGYVPDTERAASDVAFLESALENGWEAKRIEVPGRGPIALHRIERFRILRVGDGWRFKAEHLGSSARRATPLEAAQDFVDVLERDTRRLVRALDRELDDEERERKETLLSRVDLIGSRLDALGSPTTWVCGTLQRDEAGALWLSAGREGERYEVPPSVPDVVVGDRLWLAEVQAGPSGVPIGPVLRVEALAHGDAAAVWAAWREKLAS